MENKYKEELMTFLESDQNAVLLQYEEPDIPFSTVYFRYLYAVRTEDIPVIICMRNGKLYGIRKEEHYEN